MHLLFVSEMARLLISSLENRKKRRRNKRGERRISSARFRLRIGGLSGSEAPHVAEKCFRLDDISDHALHLLNTSRFTDQIIETRP